MVKSGDVVDMGSVSRFSSSVFRFFVACVAGFSLTFSASVSWYWSESVMLCGCGSQRGFGSGGSLVGCRGSRLKNQVNDVASCEPTP